MCARPKLQSRTQRKQESALRSWGRSSSVALQKCMELSPTSGALVTGRLHVESFSFALNKKLLFDNFPKAPGIFFLKSTARKSNTEGSEGGDPFSTLIAPQQCGEATNAAAGKEEGSVTGKHFTEWKELQKV